MPIKATPRCARQIILIDQPLNRQRVANDMNRTELLEKARSILRDAARFQLLLPTSQQRSHKLTTTNEQEATIKCQSKLKSDNESVANDLRKELLVKENAELRLHLEQAADGLRRIENKLSNTEIKLQTKETEITELNHKYQSQQQQIAQLLKNESGVDQLEPLQRFMMKIQDQNQQLQDEAGLLKAEHTLSVKQILSFRNQLLTVQGRCDFISEKESNAVDAFSLQAIELAALKANYAALQVEHDIVIKEKQRCDRKCGILSEGVQAEREVNLHLEAALNHSKQTSTDLVNSLHATIEDHQQIVDRIMAENDGLRKKIELLLLDDAESIMEKERSGNRKLSTKRVTQCHSLAEIEQQESSSDKKAKTNRSSMDICVGCGDPPYGLMVRCTRCYASCHAICVRRCAKHEASGERREFLCSVCQIEGDGKAKIDSQV